ncbi:MAG: DUF2764 family protein [Candidatus Coatesbacteria bacterium]|nr:DUF2764 family protein [Candidatus Coatesbacteria bacterium]
MAKYYSFVSGLPQLKWDSKPPFEFSEWIALVRSYLTKDDNEIFSSVLLIYDIRNLVSIKKGEKPPHEPANFTYKDLEGFLRQPSMALDFMERFLISEEDYDDALEMLYIDYYDNILKKVRLPILKDYIYLELALLRTQSKIQLKNEAYKKEISADALHIAENKLPDILSQTSDLKKMQANYDLVLWDFLSERIACRHWSMEVIIAYHLKLMLLEKWHEIRTADGDSLLEEISMEVNI